MNEFDAKLQTNKRRWNKMSIIFCHIGSLDRLDMNGEADSELKIENLKSIVDLSKNSTIHFSLNFHDYWSFHASRQDFVYLELNEPKPDQITIFDNIFVIKMLIHEINRRSRICWYLRDQTIIHGNNRKTFFFSAEKFDLNRKKFVQSKNVNLFNLEIQIFFFPPSFCFLSFKSLM